MKKHRGFTLIELMIVVAIIGILAAIAVPNYNDYVVRARITPALSALSDSRVRMEQYYQDNRNYNGDGLAATVSCGVVAPTATSTFTYACVTDNSGQTYVITATGAGSMTGFSYTGNQSNVKTSAIAAGAVWAATTQGTCWITNKGGC